MRLFKFIAACALAAVVNAPASASQVTYDFSFTATEGSLAGNSFSGSFSYDSSIVQPAQITYGAHLLDSLSFSFGGQTYTTANTSTVDLSWNMLGNLSGLLLGTNCTVVDGCTVQPGVRNWSISLYPVSPEYSTIYYSLPSDSRVYSASNFAVNLAPVPEPAPMVLMSAGLVVLFSGRRLTRKLRAS
jgi:hypothetical protein